MLTYIPSTSPVLCRCGTFLLSWGVTQILYGLAFPEKFVRRLMKCIRSVFYFILINGIPTEPFEAKKGLRQGDLLSPFLFVLVMKYLTRSLKTLKQIPDFNYHPRCEKLRIVQLGFADDLLLFCRGNLWSIQLLYKCFKQFSQASGLMVNKSKSSVFFGGVDVVDNIMDCENLVLRLSKKIIQLIEATCRKFSWTGQKEGSKKAPMLWIQWVHVYYIKKELVWEVDKPTASWIIRKILKAKRHFDEVGYSQQEVMDMANLSIKKLYQKLRGDFTKVPWRRLVCNNVGLPKWIFTLRLAAHGKLYTITRLAKWGVVDDKECVLCNIDDEDVEHLFFKCPYSKTLWTKLLGWKGIYRHR
ncbi:uncharacterized protein LOC132617915 [Lycium barbarum]|uniref:uncharacterized protein LOC132617915 n=1 Tax=Lycium barbarum TaxID=112863 RepID=UPI00293F6427|nr:uncharacterized protein LOC132617915 [Lycium barbarum]